MYHVADAHYYVPTDAVEALPRGCTPAEFVLRSSEAGAEPPYQALPLQTLVQSFLDGPSPQLLLVLGEPGLGKTAFTWLTAGRCLRSFNQWATSKGPKRPSVSPWIPVVLDLKDYCVSELQGLLPRVLVNKFGMPRAAVESLQQGHHLPEDTWLTRLVVFCDGFDELKVQEGEPSIRDFVGTLCGGEWAASCLKVVVTSRESVLAEQGEEGAVFGDRYARAVMLPFSHAKVSAANAWLWFGMP
jgi:hypothetical protein